MKRQWLFIAAGGAIGALVRYGVKSGLASQALNEFPMATLGVNLVGAFLIGVVLTATTEYLDMPLDLRLGIVTGFLGGLTTFSTLCKEIVTLFGNGHGVLAMVYTLLSLGIGFLCVHLGCMASRRLAPLGTGKGVSR